MIRICSVCKREYGVKCPICGSEAALDMTGNTTLFACPNLLCEVGQFEADAGGMTHGICQECAKRRPSERDEEEPNGKCSH